jgi:hypothetical protein
MGGTPAFFQYPEYPSPGHWRLLVQLNAAVVQAGLPLGDGWRSRLCIPVGEWAHREISMAELAGHAPRTSPICVTWSSKRLAWSTPDACGESCLIGARIRQPAAHRRVVVEHELDDARRLQFG